MALVCFEASLELRFAKQFRRPVGRRPTFSCLPKRKLGKEKGTLRTPSLRASHYGHADRGGLFGGASCTVEKDSASCRVPCGRFHLAPLDSRREPEDQQQRARCASHAASRHVALLLPPLPSGER